MERDQRIKTLILGAAGRDFHNFNCFFRGNARYEVVAFTATQIPRIEVRTFPASIAGSLYPEGIPIVVESQMEEVIAKHDVRLTVHSYSDVTYEHVMHLSARATAAGSDFMLLGTKSTMIPSKKPVLAVTAVRTGCGKSQTSRWICQFIRDAGKKIVAIRHPMPYGNLAKQAVQRFATMADMDLHQCTIEEREEYEKHVEEGGIIYAGVDYQAILKEAEKEADIILWDGGNNDMPFVKPDLWIALADPFRVGHESSSYPGEANIRGSDVILIGKANVAAKEDMKQVTDNCRALNSRALIFPFNSILTVDKPELIKGKRVLCVEDGPTLTHGQMKFGAAMQAAKEGGAKELVDPRPFLVGSIKDTFAKYPNVGTLLPAMGYWDEQVKDLEATINATECDTVMIGTPFDLQRLMKINKPVTIVKYTYQDMPGQKGLSDVLKEFMAKHL